MSKLFAGRRKSHVKISNPINFNPTKIEAPISVQGAIILITKYNFQAHNSKELTVDCGEPLKLISRQGNGWLLVKPIGRLGGPGLVPSSYCCIVNTESNLDQEWLDGNDKEDLAKARAGSDISHSSNSSSENSMSRTDPNSVSSVEEESRVQQDQILPTMSISVKTVSSHRGRYWYRTDVLIPKSTVRCLCRYYQDFYSLHASICGALSSSTIRNGLPKLPGPIPRPDPEVLLQRCHDLNSYIYRLNNFVNTGETQDLKEAQRVFTSWLEFRDGDIELEYQRYMQLRTEEINRLIDPLAPVSTKNSGEFPQIPKRHSNHIIDPSQFPMEVVTTTLLSSAEPSPITSPLISSPGQFTNAGSTTPERPSRDDTKLEYSPTSPLFHNDRPKLNFINERRSQSPKMSSTPRIASEEYTRVKVIFNDGNDIIALKMLKDSNLTILKLSISSKIHLFDYVLSYKDFNSGFFKPLRSDKDLHDAVYKNKIVIKVNEVESIVN